MTFLTEIHFQEKHDINLRKLGAIKKYIGRYNKILGAIKKYIGRYNKILAL